MILGTPDFDRAFLGIVIGLEVAYERFLLLRAPVEDCRPYRACRQEIGFPKASVLQVTVAADIVTAVKLITPNKSVRPS